MEKVLIFHNERIEFKSLNKILDETVFKQKTPKQRINEKRNFKESLKFNTNNLGKRKK